MTNEIEDESLGVEQLPQAELEATSDQSHDPRPGEVVVTKEMKGNPAATDDPAAAPGG